jgi:hypothetical protein
MRFVFILLFIACATASAQPPPAIVHAPGPRPDGYYFLFTYKMFGKLDTTATCRMIMDGDGHCVYYRYLINSLNFKHNDDGRISCFEGTSHRMYDPQLQLLDSAWCRNGYRTDVHEFAALPGGNLLLLGYEEVEMDLSGYPYFLNNKSPGSRKAKVQSNIVQEVNADGKVIFEWRAKDHYGFDDMDESFLSDTAKVDWTHMNSIDKDAEGNYLLSVRNFNEITKIDPSGKIIWRLGGKRNQFAIDDSLKFAAQHDARFRGKGRISFFDNTGRASDGSTQARGVVYELDEAGRNAHLVWSHTAGRGTKSIGNGNVQVLNDGSVLVNYGKIEGRNITFEHVTQDDKPVFNIRFRDTLATYRAHYYPKSLLKLERPQIEARASGGKVKLSTAGQPGLRWSSGETTQEVVVSKPGIYFVECDARDGGKVVSDRIRIDLHNGKLVVGKRNLGR